MERLRNIFEFRIRAHSHLPRFVWLAAGALLVSAAQAQGTLGAKINVTPLASYTGSNPLPKPEKILVYDFAINPEDVQVDKIQSLSSPPSITGDQKPDSIAASASKTYSQELVKALEKTGIPVEHVAAGTPPSDNAMVIQGR